MTGKAVIVFGLGWGDEGKGGIIDYLARKNKASLVVRYNSSVQCGHNVVLSDGRHHQFHCFGSASLISGVKTHIARTVSIEPYEMEAEVGLIELKIGEYLFLKSRVTVDPMAPVITPYHWTLNRLRESLRGVERHGSCGYGVGELRDWMERGLPTIRAYELVDSDKYRPRLMEKLLAIRKQAFREAANGSMADKEWLQVQSPWQIADFYQMFARRLVLKTDEEVRHDLSKQVTIFEGGQGVLLDETYGCWAPHTTWSDTTPRLAKEFINGAVQTEIVGVIRTYATRHGAGPFPTEDKELTPDSGEHNCYNEYQGAFRLGHFDLLAFRYAMACAGRIDAVALTHCDRKLDGWGWFYGKQYNCGGSTMRMLTPGMPADIIAQYKAQYQTAESRDIVEAFEEITGAHVGYVSFGPTEKDKCERKEWNGTGKTEETGKEHAV